MIGTHRLLSSDIGFKDLGLVVVDEEQRFGVAHKERLKKLRAQVDVLTMSATPIPRTLEMALAGIRDMSTVDTPPEDRQPVLTYVGQYDEGLALGAVRRELLREGQVFWVHNRVATIERQAAWLQEQVPDARIVVAHGQMDEDMLERRMIRFWDREADILMSTVIIESGLDVPNANTLVVDAANLLGLSQMYQLRGRVGRSHERAFAYFFFPPQRELTDEAHERLTTIARHQALGSGFQIALRDLEIRGAGNVLGAEQHGHIAAVGFDTYARLLQESVAEMKGEPLPEEKEIRIDLPVRAFVPPGWLEQEALRLDLYRRISSAGDHDLLERVRTETVDRFGQLPQEVETLFAVASLRITCARLGVGEVSTYRQQVRIKPLDAPRGARARSGRAGAGGSVPAHDRDAEPRHRSHRRVPSCRVWSSSGWSRATGSRRGRCYDALRDPTPAADPACSSSLSCSPCCSRHARTIRRSAATVGDGEISIDQLHADVALFGFLTALSGAPCGTPVEGESQDAACARFTLANDIREELAKAYAADTRPDGRPTPT